MPPLTGTFKLLPAAIRTGWGSGIFSMDGGYAPANDVTVGDYFNSGVESGSGVDLYKALNHATCVPVTRWPSPGTFEVNLRPDYNNIIFNPGTGSEELIGFFDNFPAGFIATNTKLYFKGYLVNNPGLTCILNFTIGHKLNIVTYDTVQPDIGAFIYTPNINVSPAFGYGALDILFGYQFYRVVVQAGILGGCAEPVVGIYVRSNLFYLTGDYYLWSHQLSLSPGITSNPTSNQITLEDGEGKLGEIEDLYITYIDENHEPIRTLIPSETIQKLSNFKWLFWIPATWESGSPTGQPPIIEGFIPPGVEFTGYVPLGTLYPTLVRGSGIYTLVPGQRHDTYYNRSITPATTVNMTIPNPFGKTGFFNGK